MDKIENRTTGEQKRTGGLGLQKLRLKLGPESGSD
ncbi:Uncharacterised protein [Niallia circulans]|nr:Uncharacterised protein [Niallia circulans]